MRIVLCWGGISGYAAACWRALAALPGVELHVIAIADGLAMFNDEIIAGLRVHQLHRTDERYVRALVKEMKPDVLYVTGWSHGPYRRLIQLPEYDRTVKWLGVDTPWRGDLRQRAMVPALRRLVSRFDRVLVAGERAWQYLRILKMPQARVTRGLYGVDFDALAPLLQQRRSSGEWPKRFLFMGRYAPEKGIETLVEAYAKYRESVNEPWPLTCCGRGELGAVLKGRAGVEDLGFQQPAQVTDILRRHGAFVLASSFDPWPLVIVEAAAAGLPVLCTEACGSAVELVRPYFNGITAATGDIGALAAALCWTHAHHGHLATMGARSRDLAAAYSAQMWATRWLQAARDDLAVKGN